MFISPCKRDEPKRSENFLPRHGFQLMGQNYFRPAAKFPRNLLANSLFSMRGICRQEDKMQAKWMFLAAAAAMLASNAQAQVAGPYLPSPYLPGGAAGTGGTLPTAPVTHPTTICTVVGSSVICN